MKKIMLIIPVLVLSILASAQPHMETTIKIVAGKARIAVKWIGAADLMGSPSGTTFCIAIPAANSAAVLNPPTVLDASRLPSQASLTTGNFTDATYKYFIFLWAGGTAPVTFVNGTEYDLVELTWTGTGQTCPVSLISLANGNIGGGNTVLEGQWDNYLEVGGAQVSFGDQLFYQSATSNPPAQMAQDYTSGTALVTTSTPIFTLLPVNLLNFSGYKNGGKNSLLWSTASEENNRGFEVQRSTDGVIYDAIGFVNSRATGGNSVSTLSYTFDDNNPLGKKQYYRLRQVDIDGRNKLSNIVLIKGDKPEMLGIGGLFPNPARTQVNVIIDAPRRDNVTLVVLDMAGKTVKQQLVNVELGSNTVPVDIAKLAQGSYLVKVLCQSSDCETAVGKFNKQ